MEEETDLLGSKKGKDVVTTGDTAILQDSVAPMDATTSPSPEAQSAAQTHVPFDQSNSQTPVPPLALSTAFAKPKNKTTKKKTKSLGPIPKETKNSAQKIYDLPLTSKKQANQTLPQMLPSIQAPFSSPPLAPTNLDKPPLLLPEQSIDRAMSPPKTLPAASPNSTFLPIASTPGTEPLLPKTGYVNSPAVVQDVATLPSTSSQ
ncbi:hypothetical protein SLA2020_091590 [Shorea laevis]